MIRLVFLVLQIFESREPPDPTPIKRAGQGSPSWSPQLDRSGVMPRGHMLQSHTVLPQESPSCLSLSPSPYSLTGLDKPSLLGRHGVRGDIVRCGPRCACQCLTLGSKDQADAADAADAAPFLSPLLMSAFYFPLRACCWPSLARRGGLVPRGSRAIRLSGFTISENP